MTLAEFVRYWLETKQIVPINTVLSEIELGENPEQ